MTFTLTLTLTLTLTSSKTHLDIDISAEGHVILEALLVLQGDVRLFTDMDTQGWKEEEISGMVHPGKYEQNGYPIEISNLFCSYDMGLCFNFPAAATHRLTNKNTNQTCER